jgi:hypothetical protein
VEKKWENVGRERRRNESNESKGNGKMLNGRGGEVI